MHFSESRHFSESQRERQILMLVAEQQSSQDISKRLRLSVRTVDNHRYNICAKLGLSGNNALLKFALTYRPIVNS